MTQPASFPSRYDAVECVGRGGGGEVVGGARQTQWRGGGGVKLLRLQAQEAEMLALVREATVLSGVEGLGVPRVIHFGRLPDSGRAFMVRELVPGRSLAELLDGPADARRCLQTVARAAEQVSLLHQALLLHGDIKPANIIAGDDGSATLVDLGLAAFWQEGGARPEGLTPRYAAPELLVGEPLTPQAEVFALGATAQDVVSQADDPLEGQAAEQVEAVLRRATHKVARERYPSADEFAQALCSALGIVGSPATGRRRAWSIVAIDKVHARSAQPGERVGCWRRAAHRWSFWFWTYHVGTPAVMVTGRGGP